MLEPQAAQVLHCPEAELTSRQTREEPSAQWQVSGCGHVTRCQRYGGLGSSGWGGNYGCQDLAMVNAAVREAGEALNCLEDQLVARATSKSDYLSVGGCGRSATLRCESVQVPTLVGSTLGFACTVVPKGSVESDGALSNQ